MDAARSLFAQLGYQRATIRSIAQEADVDPGLVMHYFGSKQQLFAQAAIHQAEELAGSTPEEVAGSMLNMLRDRLANEPVASLAVLRSMLTHNDAASTYQPRCGLSTRAGRLDDRRTRRKSACQLDERDRSRSHRSEMAARTKPAQRRSPGRCD